VLPLILGKAEVALLKPDASFDTLRFLLNDLLQDRRATSVIPCFHVNQGLFNCLGKAQQWTEEQ